MDITLNVKLDEKTLDALKGLIPALVDVSVTQPAGSKAEAATEEEPILWANHKTGAHGEAASKAEFDKIKAKDKGAVRVTQKQYDELVAKAEKAEEEPESAPEPEPEPKAPAKKAPAKKAPAKKAAGSKDAEEVPERADLIAAFTEFLPKDLDADERKERREFVTTLLQRFGADRVSEMDEQHWALAIKLVEKKLAGEDVDPAVADFDQLGDDEDDDLV